MDLTLITAFFGWMSIINLIIISIGFFEITVLKGPISHFHAGLFGINEQDTLRTFYQVIAYYKIGILMFNIVPYLALKLIQMSSS